MLSSTSLAFATVASAAVMMSDMALLILEDSRPYVTIAPDGAASTITPDPTTAIDGTVSTISPVPATLTQTSVYVMIDSHGYTSTSTGTAPVAMATSTSGAGAFLQCGNARGVGAPFCSPSNGSQVQVGETYYVTWDTSFFPSTSEAVWVQGSYNKSSTDEAGKFVSTHGFTSEDTTSGAGYWAWTVDDERTPVGTRVSLSLWYANPEALEEGALLSVEGPVVAVVMGADVKEGPGGSPNNALAIALPVVLISVALVIGTWLCMRKRSGIRTEELGAAPHWPGHGHGRVGKGSGYGVGQSWGQRTGKRAEDAGIQLRDSPTSPTYGETNVFREELRRQEAQRW
ncbi:hypothetical protein F5Y15DRAFT_328636 [Xylariaceae sp. FL0016]|nr:hypothetical protein F5Y15DRAFT_328636 [Xylariaceae sp. FL0016]